MQMNEDKVVEILQNEMACVIRAETGRCNMDCARCDLVKPAEEIIEAYSQAINTVYAMKEIRKLV